MNLCIYSSLIQKIIYFTYITLVRNKNCDII